MKTIKLSMFICGVFLAVFGAAAMEARAQAGVICDFPSVCEPVFEFKAWDLPFSTGRKAEFAEGETAASDEFYAVVLSSQPFEKNKSCRNITEKTRLAAQKLFAKKKVFTSHYCDFDNVMYYDGLTAGYNFMAVHAGATEAEAKKLLKIAVKKFPSANVRKMTARLDFTDGQAVGDQ